MLVEEVVLKLYALGLKSDPLCPADKTIVGQEVFYSVSKAVDLRLDWFFSRISEKVSMMIPNTMLRAMTLINTKKLRSNITLGRNWS